MGHHKYLKCTLEDIIKTNQTVESQTKNALSQLEVKAEKETLTEFGATFHHYKKVFLGEMSND